MVEDSQAADFTAMMNEIKLRVGDLSRNSSDIRDKGRTEHLAPDALRFLFARQPHISAYDAYGPKRAA